MRDYTNIQLKKVENIRSNTTRINRRNNNDDDSDDSSDSDGNNRIKNTVLTSPTPKLNQSFPNDNLIHTSGLPYGYSHKGQFI